ncbi:MAG: peptide-methionine (S)-S-oxide reductase MsrA [Candidatus Portiera sp.]|nr:peptide-methionine (S)-S-oxide reductase MsrA [Portiera sp.]
MTKITTTKIKPRLLNILATLVVSLTLSITLAPPSAHSVEKSAEKIAVFAGGCFWCMEEAYEKIPGVTKVVSGYSGGKTKNPTYEKVTYGKTGHLEAVRVYYDDKKVSYQELLDAFWRNIDPLDDRGQFCDKGPSYKSAIFYLDDQQLKLATKSLNSIKEQVKGKVVTPILSFKEFYDAEPYHQDYYKTNPIRYKYYKYGCGRPARLQELWG